MSLSGWFSSFFSRSDGGDHPQETTKRDITSDRRKCTLVAEAKFEIYLHSEIQPKSDIGQEASPAKLKKLLHEESSEGSTDSPVDFQHGQLSIYTREVRATNDNLLASSHDDQDHDQNEGDEEAFDEHCSPEMQDALDELHQALLSSWPTECNPSHQAMLRLIATRAKGKKSQEHGDNGVKFDVIFSTHHQKWVESRFVVGAAVGRGKVRFVDQPEAPQSAIDICELIESSASYKSHILFRVSSHALRSTRSIMGQDGFWSSKGRISLTQLVSLTSTTRRGALAIEEPLLPDSYKAVLAVILAYSLWHLSKGAWTVDENEGPWLHRKWTDEGFYFVASSNQEIDIGRPYLPTILTNPNSSADPAMSHVAHPSASILAFAMLLINLQSPACRQSFTDARTERVQEDGGETMNTDYLAALNLLKSRNFKIHVNKEYKKAITACLEGNFLDGIPDPNVEESETRKGFFQQVVLPLKRNLKAVWDYSPDNLGEFLLPLPEDLMAFERDPNCAPCSDIAPQSKPILPKQDRIPHAGDGGTARVVPTSLSRTDELCLYADSDEESQFRTVESKDAQDADKWFRLLETRVHPLITAEKGQGRIKIAILDTGIQLPAEANVVYEEQIKCHKSWLRGEPGNTGDESGKGDRDLDGHGTHCASLLLKVCPNAAIYVARVFRKRSERKGAVESIETQQAIADAITYAANEWKVDIITMSFGCKDRVNVINDAIVAAHNKHILLFAAASNCGGNDEIAWPAKSDKVICVHATDGYGKSTRFTPNALSNADNFAVLGSAVKSYWPEALTGEGLSEMRMSGTSCAAPIAAGIAAVIMEFVCRKSRVNTEFANETRFKRLGERQVMSYILRKMVPRRNAGYDYIVPWTLFDSMDKDYDENYVLQKILRAIKEAG